MSVPTAELTRFVTLCQALGQATTFNGPYTLEDVGFLKRGKVANLLDEAPFLEIRARRSVRPST